MNSCDPDIFSVSTGSEPDDGSDLSIHVGGNIVMVLKVKGTRRRLVRLVREVSADCNGRKGMIELAESGNSKAVDANYNKLLLALVVASQEFSVLHKSGYRAPRTRTRFNLPPLTEYVPSSLGASLLFHRHQLDQVDLS